MNMDPNMLPDSAGMALTVTVHAPTVSPSQVMWNDSLLHPLRFKEKAH